MKHLILTATITSLVLVMGMGVAQAVKAAGASTVIDEETMPRRPGDSKSGSGDTVEVNCGGLADANLDGVADVLGSNYGQGATATLSIKQAGEGSTVAIKVEDAEPNTHFTVWLRIKGGTGFNSGGTPWTGGGATPLCSGTEFADLNSISPWNNTSGDTAKHCNSFKTKANGSATFKSIVNFPVVGGAYPFQQAGGATAHPTKGGAPDVPTAIVDPRTGTGGPFMIRVVSHCTDQSNHGLSPGDRETWFQFP